MDDIKIGDIWIDRKDDEMWYLIVDKNLSTGDTHDGYVMIRSVDENPRIRKISVYALRKFYIVFHDLYDF